ncbi:MAG: hypothetical protein JWP29_144 [Rhodoferax sp.]|nr:hypothetical protein [Rhodoferax sp.]
MKTKLIEGVDARIDDTDILEAIAAEDEDDFGYGGSTMVIGIRNSAGQIYRAIHTDGLTEFMHTIARLQGADLRTLCKTRPVICMHLES